MSDENHPWTKRVLKQGAESAQALKIKLDSFVQAFRTDSWSNALTGINTTRDKTSMMLPYVEALLTPQMLEVLFSTDDIAARIVSAIPDEALKKPWSVAAKNSDEDDVEASQELGADLAADLDLLGAREKIREAMTWGRLYGLGAILIGVDDGQDPWEPLDWNRVQGIRYLTTLDKRDLVPWRWYGDPTAPKFGDIALYQVQPVGVFLGAPYDITQTNQIILVHETRLLRFGGELTSRRERLRNQGADYSILQKCFRALQLTNNNWQSASTLLADASQGVFKIKGLIDMISQQPDVMQTRMQLVDMMRSTVRALVLDTEEDFTRTPTPLAGIPDILRETWTRLAAAARMPLTVLMGTSPGGLNATGESDMQWWYDTIASTQESVIKPELEYLIRILATSRRYEDPQNWTVVFPALKQMNELEQSQLHNQQATADNIYVTAGVLTPEEVALSRFGSGKYNLDTKIDVEIRKKVMEMSAQQMVEEAENSLETAKNPPPIATPGVIEQGRKPRVMATAPTPDSGPPGVQDA